MNAREAIEVRLRRGRRLAWLVSPVIAVPATFILGILRGPAAPLWLWAAISPVTTLTTALLLVRAFTESTRDLLAARVGTDDERRARLAAPLGRFDSPTTRAAVALECGEMAKASALLRSVRAIDRHASVFRLIALREALATGEREYAIAALLEWRQRPRLGVITELMRYHAFVLACALAERPPEHRYVIAAAKRLRADSDREVRAYATWLPGADDDDAERWLLGAELARAVGYDALAQTLETRAARLASSRGAPYRAG